MKVIGFRNSTSSLRYAVLEVDGEDVTFLNASEEHCIKYPKDIADSASKLEWLFNEIQRVLRKHEDAACCAIKTNEYGRAEKKATRFTSHADAATMIACAKGAKHVSDFIYSQLPTSSKNVKSYSEKLVGTSDKYWDNQIADAIAVAYAVGRASSD